MPVGRGIPILVTGIAASFPAALSCPVLGGLPFSALVLIDMQHDLIRFLYRIRGMCTLGLTFLVLRFLAFLFGFRARQNILHHPSNLLRLRESVGDFDGSDHAGIPLRFRHTWR